MFSDQQRIQKDSKFGVTEEREEIEEEGKETKENMTAVKKKKKKKAETMKTKRRVEQVPQPFGFHGSNDTKLLFGHFPIHKRNITTYESVDIFNVLNGIPHSYRVKSARHSPSPSFGRS